MIRFQTNYYNNSVQLVSDPVLQKKMYLNEIDSSLAQSIYNLYKLVYGRLALNATYRSPHWSLQNNST